MSTSQFNIKDICNYKESDKPSKPKGVIYYMEMLDSNDEWVMNQIKRENRQRVINDVLGETQEEINEMEWPSAYGDNLNNNVSSPRVLSVNVTASNFIDDESLYDNTVRYLDNITNNPMKTQSNSLDINKLPSSYENDNTISRKIATRITLCSSLISMNSRIGPPRNALIGNDLFMYLVSLNSALTKTKDDYFFNGIKLIRSNFIKPNKFIAIRTSNDLGCGLNVSKHNDGRYFIKETPTYEKVITWFELI